MSDTFREKFTGKDQEIVHFAILATSEHKIEWNRKIVCGSVHYTGIMCDEHSGYFWAFFINLAVVPAYLTLHPIDIEIVSSTTYRLNGEEKEHCVLHWSGREQYWEARGEGIISLIYHIDEMLKERMKIG